MRIKTFTFVAVLIIVCNSAAVRAAGESAAHLYTSKQYFELRDLIQSHSEDSSKEFLFFQGVVANRFNQPYRSILYLRQYMKRMKAEKNPAWLVDCYEILADNYLKTCQYRKAAAAYRAILTRLDQKLDDEARKDYENSFRLWNALRNIPRQTTEFRGDSTIPAKLTAVPFEINQQKLSFGFDSGADISIIIKSLALKLGLHIIDASIEVGSITGKTVKAGLGISRELKLGNVLVRNVVFLVFDDKDLLGPTGGEVKGIIGFL